MSRYEIDRETSDKAERLANKLNRKVNDTVLSRHRAPNGGYYEQNDIDYLLSNGYSEEAALDELAKSEKYRRRAGSAESGRAGGARAAAGRDAGYGGSGGSGGRTDGRGNGQKCTKAMLGDAAAAAGLSVPAYAAYMGYEIVTEEEYEIYMESTEYVEFELIDDSDIDWEEIDEDDIDFDDYEDVDDDVYEEDDEDDDDEYEEDGNEEDYEDDGEDGCEDEDEDVEEEEEYEEEDYEEDGDEEDYEEDGGDEEGDCDEE